MWLPLPVNPFTWVIAGFNVVMTNGMFILVLLEIIRDLCVKFEVFSQILN